MYFPAALVVNLSLYPKVPYDLDKDFTPVTLLGTFPLVLVVNASLPVQNVADLIRYARASRAACTSPPSATPARRTSRGNSSSSWRASTSCTCPTRAARRRRPTSSAGRLK
ncbi:MAG: hypothetical protein EXR31_04595 [Betaproteobacteria bacterium]|nr:hypothetical protein [Betaproteobacteria bacterium]